MNADTIKIRCHRIGTIMTASEKRISEAATCNSYLRQLAREIRWGRKEVIKSKYLTKGLESEQDAITLFSRVTKTNFSKNKERIENGYLSGEPDLFRGISIRKASEGWDTKCAWDWTTFPFENDKLEPKDKFQAHGYMALTGASKWTIVYCLVNASASLVHKEKQNVWYEMKCPEQGHPDHPAYIEKCIEIEKNMIFDMSQFIRDNPNYDLDSTDWNSDIPMNERILQFPVMRNEEIIEQIYQRIDACRSWMNANLFSLHKELEKTV